VGRIKKRSYPLYIKMSTWDVSSKKNKFFKKRKRKKIKGAIRKRRRV